MQNTAPARTLTVAIILQAGIWNIYNTQLCACSLFQIHSCPPLPNQTSIHDSTRHARLPSHTAPPSLHVQAIV